MPTQPGTDRKILASGILKVAAGLLAVLLPLGLLTSYVARVREQSRVTQCQSNLRLIGLAIRNYHSTYSYFPPGTLPNPYLPAERRLSWIVDMIPFMEQNIELLIDKTKASDDPANDPPRWRACIDKKENLFTEPSLVNPRYFRCPPAPAEPKPSQLTCYVGVAGLGESAAELPLGDPRAGFFGYDRTISDKDVKDGTSNTLAVTEVTDGGQFTAGGRATVRGLAGGSPYLGAGGQFPSRHHGGDSYWSRPVVTNVAFADGHARSLTDAVSPTLFEALATIAGGEDVGEW
jgi:prepilin-type processing-associated H-X9-DG protein